MSNVKTHRIAEYNLNSYLEWEVEAYISEKPEFIERYEHYRSKELDKLIGSLQVSEITREIIEDIIWQDENLPGDAYEYFEEEMNNYFGDYQGKTAKIEGKNMGWRNRTGNKEIEIDDGVDIFKAIAVNSDLTFEIWREDEEGVYYASMSHHDSPMGESYTITIK